MKREIKFRAWDDDSDSMLYQDKDKELCVFAIDESGICCWIFPGESMYGQDPCDLESTPCYEIMQYTGLKDKNGKEIYEGDILRYVYSDLLFNWLISFDDGAFIFQSIGIDGYLMDKYRLTQSNCLDREVIGNIYENPELIRPTLSS